MARTPNFGFEKRKREQERKAKKEAKREDRRQKREAERDDPTIEKGAPIVELGPDGNPAGA